ncbi:hypothetical protein PR202_gb11241 [Eleusine coracana subsp. coracana]|uniref:Amidase domain-containing protein n=1 Tax=Eleusine coracana subsp. coracana TaxID=191504 RepID=A0AAV5EJQ1_ELECO|nr:hypothetical protein PR202_gb11241 [Eleusine coracana subsp. coracana]
MASSGAATNIFVLLGLGIAGVILAARRLRRPARPDHGAFIARLELLPPPQPPPPQAPHPLTGLCFAIADALHVRGYITSFGSLEWTRTHEEATQTSPVVSALVDGGATCVGKTVIDEMAYSIHGDNKHFDTPTNPAAPDRVPGGCSSGSAVAVAGGMVDFALGIDSIGGVRIPGAYCGVLAFRPSHAVVSNSGVIPVAPSLDTIGWFARDPSVLRRVGHLLLRLPYADIRPPRHFYIADDCFELSKIPARKLTQVVTKSVEKLFGRQVTRVNLGNYLASRISTLKNYSNGQENADTKGPSLLAFSNAMRLLHNDGHQIEEDNPEVDNKDGHQVAVGDHRIKEEDDHQIGVGDHLINEEGSSLLGPGMQFSYFSARDLFSARSTLPSYKAKVVDCWMDAVLQSRQKMREFKDQHMEWINSVKASVDARIVSSLSNDGDSVIDNCQHARNEARLALGALLKDDGILVIPTALGSPPKLNAKELSSENYNSQTSCLSSIASMSGCCQVSIPLGTHDKCPISVSFIARHGGDRFLLDTTQTMYATIQEQVEILAKSNVSSKQAMNEEAAEAAKEKGNAAFKEKQWQKAVNFYTEAIKLNGKVPTYYSNRAAAFLELTSYRQAEADCTSAIDLDPKIVKAYLRRGTAREMLGYYKEAVEDFNHALVLEPMNKTAGVAINRLKKLFP